MTDISGGNREVTRRRKVHDLGQFGTARGVTIGQSHRTTDDLCRCQGAGGAKLTLEAARHIVDPATNFIHGMIKGDKN